MQRTLAVTSHSTPSGPPLRVVLVGLGPIGKNVADECLRRGRGRVEVVAAIDRDPALAGRTLGELWGAGRADADVEVAATLAGPAEAGDVAILTTTSRLDSLEPQLEALFALGLDVVSSAEELFYPSLSDPERAVRIDAKARRAGVSVTGGGINPGFLMDVLPLVLAMASGPPFVVRCERYVDLARRRPPLQAKAGIGMEPGEFQRLAEESRIGHVGLVESAAYLAGHLGIAVDAIEESLEPIESNAAFTWRDQNYPRGRVIGFVHQARAWGPGQDRSTAPLQLDLRMAYQQDDPRDRIVLWGTPPVDLTIRPGVAGDPATSAILVHLAARIQDAPPGLRLPHELGLLPQGPHYRIERA